MNILKKMILSFLIFTCSLYANNSMKVLILNSWSPDHNWVKGEVKGIKDALKQRHKKIEFTTEYIDYPRIQGVDKEKYIQSYHQFFNNKYINKRKKFDLIFATDDPALNYMLKYHDLYFPDTPVIFSGINNYNPKKMVNKKNKFYGVLETVDYFGTLSIAHKLHPQAKRFYILGDKTSTSQSQIAEIKKISAKFPVEFVYLDNLTFEELSKQLKSLTKNDIVFLLAFYSDSTGKQLTPQEIMDFLKKNNKAPLYGFWKWLLGRGGVIGGKVLSSYDHGKDAVNRFYIEDKEKRVLVQGGSNPYIFDYNQLVKFDIDMKKLPDNSQIINKPFSFYETYKSLVIGTIVFITLLIILLIILLFNIKKRKRLEKKLKKAKDALKLLNKDLEQTVEERTHDLTQSNDELEQTITNLKLTQAQLVESEKMASLGGLVAGVAHEINTPVGMSLTGITHFIDISENLQKEFENNNLTENDFKDFIQTSNKLASSINHNLERTAHLVRSFKQIAVDQTHEEKREFNLKKYIESSIMSLSNIIKKTNLVINMNSEDNININSYPGAFAQIITNLILNSINHGYGTDKTGTININITKTKNYLILECEDDGKGIGKKDIVHIFEPFFTTNRENGGTGLGLNIIYNIITNQLNGTIKCTSELNKGTTFLITLPFEVTTNHISENGDHWKT